MVVPFDTSKRNVGPGPSMPVDLFSLLCYVLECLIYVSNQKSQDPEIFRQKSQDPEIFKKCQDPEIFMPKNLRILRFLVRNIN